MNPASLSFLAGFAVAVFGADSRFHLEHSTDGFGMRSHGVIERMASGSTTYYPLPQSTAQQYLRLRPEDARINPLSPGRYERQETIGPWQTEDSKIWFGNSYYDGEGMKGVGAFGYFDSATREYTLFSPPEVARYEIAAILVEPEWVWLALDRFGEDISTSPGGLVQWNRTSHATEKYSLEFNISNIRREGDSLRLTTPGGYALFQDGAVRRFLKNGKPIAKFAPPPSHY